MQQYHLKNRYSCNLQIVTDALSVSALLLCAGASSSALPASPAEGSTGQLEGHWDGN